MDLLLRPEKILRKIDFGSVAIPVVVDLLLRLLSNQESNPAMGVAIPVVVDLLLRLNTKKLYSGSD